MKLYQKLLEIQKTVDNFTKDKKSFGYDYASGDQVLNAIRPKMNELGLLLKQEIIEIKSTRIDYVNSKGKEKSEMFTETKQKFTWVDVDTSEKDESLFASNGMNDWEKGLGSALTYAERYFLLKFFHVPTDGDDADNHKRKTSEGNQVQTKKEDDLEAKLKHSIASVLKLAKVKEINVYELSKKLFNESYLKKLDIEQLRKLHTTIKEG